MATKIREQVANAITGVATQAARVEERLNQPDEFDGFRVGQPVVFTLNAYLLVPATIMKLRRSREGVVNADLAVWVPVKTDKKQMNDRTGMLERVSQWEQQNREFLKCQIVDIRQQWIASEVPLAVQRPEQKMAGVWVKGDVSEVPQISPVHLKNIGGFFDATGMLFRLECYRGKRELAPGDIEPEKIEYIPESGGLEFDAAFKKLWKHGFKHSLRWDKIFLRMV